MVNHEVHEGGGVKEESRLDAHGRFACERRHYKSTGSDLNKIIPA